MHRSPLVFVLPALAIASLCACSASSNRAGDGPAARPEAQASAVPLEVAPDAPGREESGRETSGRETSGPELPGGTPDLPGPANGDLVRAELTTVGWDELSGSPVVLLREIESGEVLPIWIGMAEARAISLELHSIELQRPMTHDLMASILQNLDAQLEEVVVHDLREGTYYGLLKVRVAGEEEPRWIDTRPSDGLALALRTHARILIAKKLIDDQPEYRFLAPEAPEQVVRALGMTVVAVDDVWRRELSLPDRPGLVVIAAGGEAERRGIRRGDLIVAIGGEPAGQPVDLLDAVGDTPVGGRLELTVWREGGEITVRLSLEAPERRAADEKIV